MKRSYALQPHIVRCKNTGRLWISWEVIGSEGCMFEAYGRLAWYLHGGLSGDWLLTEIEAACRLIRPIRSRREMTILAEERNEV